jgi:hypothetical protein
MNPVADVLHTGRRVARHDEARLSVVEPERRNPVVLPVEDPGLTIRRGRRKPAEPAAEGITFLADEARERRTVPELHRAAEVGVRQSVDLKNDQTPPPVGGATLASEHAILQAVPPPEQPRASNRRAG